MKINFKNDYELYKQEFKLKNEIFLDRTPIILLIRAMNKLCCEVDTGYFIGKQTMKVNDLKYNTNKIQLKSYIDKVKETSSVSYLICVCEVYNYLEKIIELKTTLIKNKKTYQKATKILTKKKYIENKVFFRRITKEEVHRFSEISGDPNHIHMGERPVIQAMLILLLIEDYFAIKKIQIKTWDITYINPMEAESDIYIFLDEEKVLFGIVNNTICFKLSIKI